MSLSLQSMRSSRYVESPRRYPPSLEYSPEIPGSNKINDLVWSFFVVVNQNYIGSSFNVRMRAPKGFFLTEASNERLNPSNYHEISIGTRALRRTDLCHELVDWNKLLPPADETVYLRVLLIFDANCGDSSRFILLHHMNDVVNPPITRIAVGDHGYLHRPGHRLRRRKEF